MDKSYELYRTVKRGTELELVGLYYTQDDAIAALPEGVVEVPHCTDGKDCYGLFEVNNDEAIKLFEVPAK